MSPDATSIWLLNTSRNGNHFCGQPIPMPVPNIWLVLPHVHLEAISSPLVTCYIKEEIGPYLATTSFQAIVENNVYPEPFSPGQKTPAPSAAPHKTLDTLQHFSVSLEARKPKLNTVFEVQPHQCHLRPIYCPGIWAQQAEFFNTGSVEKQFLQAWFWAWQKSNTSVSACACPECLILCLSISNTVQGSLHLVE